MLLDGGMRYSKNHRKERGSYLTKMSVFEHVGGYLTKATGCGKGVDSISRR